MKHKRLLKFILLSISTFMLSSNVFANQKSIMMVGGKKIEYFGSPIKLFVNSKEVNNLPINPMFYDDFLLVPVREVFEPLDAKVTYNNTNKEINVLYKNRDIVLKIDSKTALVDKKELTMQIPAKISNDKLLIPLRFVAENMGFDVGWDGVKRIAFVNDFSEAKSEEIEIIDNGKNVDDNELEENNKQVIIDFLNTIPVVENNDKESTQKENITSSNSSSAKDISSSSFINEEHAKTIITGVDISNSRFTINASSAISSIEKELLKDNRLVFDIHNSDMNVSQTEQVISNANATGVRLGNESNKTRVVFDLSNNVVFSTSLSSDRTKIFIDFEKNKIQGFDLKKETDFDLLTIKNSTQIKPNVTYQTSPDRIVIDFPESDFENKISESNTTSNFVKNISSSIQSNSTAQIVLELTEPAHFDIKQDNNNVTIKIIKPSFNKSYYDSPNRRFVLQKQGTNSIDINSFEHIDDYTNKKYTINFKQNIESALPSGTIEANDNYVKNFNASTSNGETKLIINEQQILSPVVSEDNNNIYITMNTPKEVYPMVVVLDPGHGGTDVGANKNGVYEKDSNNAIARKTYDLIAADKKVKAYLTRTEDIKISLDYRAEFANSIGDIFISFHNNSNDNSNAVGTEVYHYPHANDSQLGYTGKQMADIIQKKLISKLGSVDRKVKSAAFVVIKKTTIPAILLEIGFVSNPTEAALLASPEYQQKAAEAVYEGILEIYSQYKPKR